MGDQELIPATSLPFAPLHYDGKVTWLNCPVCIARIELREAKDRHSFSFIEYRRHYTAAHPPARKTLGDWFRRSTNG